MADVVFVLHDLQGNVASKVPGLTLEWLPERHQTFWLGNERWIVRDVVHEVLSRSPSSYREGDPDPVFSHEQIVTIVLAPDPPGPDEPAPYPGEVGSTFTCLQCKRVSHNPSDVLQRYCGACHLFYDANDVSRKFFNTFNETPL